MRLSDLDGFKEIVIQCHDNPDADAIGSGYVLYRYFLYKKKKVRFVYSGKFRISKSNLTYFTEQLQIPIEYVDGLDHKPELLLLCDCQFGESNVTRLEGKTLAIIDHHQVSGTLPPLSEVRSGQGSCCTIVWDMIRAEKDGFELDKNMGTALYYGLYTDTNSFTEMYHPLDNDMSESLGFDQSLINKLKNMNLSLEEAKIAGIALLGVEYYEEHRYAILETEPCDPNILGLISDFFLAVDSVDICLAYSVLSFGVKFSVRSCTKETRADELAAYIAGEIGSGGGHIQKAGGFIQNELIAAHYPKYAKVPDKSKGFIVTEILRSRMDQYFNECDILYAEKDTVDTGDLQIYKRVSKHLAWMDPEDFIPAGQMAMLRMVSGDQHIQIKKDTVLLIDFNGEVIPISGENFKKSYVKQSGRPGITPEYEPLIRSVSTGETFNILQNAQACIPSDTNRVYAKPLKQTTKVFTLWDNERYLIGKKGDYLIVRTDDPHDISIVRKDVFKKIYRKVQ